MTISINDMTQVVTVEQSDLTLISGTLYEFDTDAFRHTIGALLDDEEGIWHPLMFTHNTTVQIAGVTYARQILMINGYTLEFENVPMTVLFTGSNNNLFDAEAGILRPSGNVTVVGQNSAGLVQVESSSLTASQEAQLTWLYERFLQREVTHERTDGDAALASHLVLYDDLGTPVKKAAIASDVLGANGWADGEAVLFRDEWEDI